MAKDKYETKPLTAEKEQKAVKKDTCVLCHTDNVVVKFVNGCKIVTCLEGQCGYVAKYKDGKLI